MIDDKAKKNLSFCYSFFGTLAVFGAVILFGALSGIGGYGLLVLALLSIPIAIIGLILWLILRQKNKMLAIGFLCGGLVPITVLFAVTGGCGLFLY